jgi:DtxR family Mn-dependent transcriptional regulator
VSDRFVEHLDRLLEHPTHDPHGDPIPAADGTVPATPDRRLIDAGPRSRFRISRLLAQDRASLARLAALGLRPGVEVVVEEGAGTGRVSETEEGDFLRLRLDDGEVSLSTGLAALIEGEIL